jgi:hypothetical protein
VQACFAQMTTAGHVLRGDFAARRRTSSDSSASSRGCSEVGRAIFEQRAVAKADGLAAFEAVGVRAGDPNILAGVVHDRPKLMRILERGVVASENLVASGWWSRGGCGWRTVWGWLGLVCGVAAPVSEMSPPTHSTVQPCAARRALAASSAASESE